MKSMDIAWLAGLLEGEGSFMLCNGSPNIQMMSVDRDIAARACHLLGVRVGGPYQPKRKPGSIGPPYQQVFSARVGGAPAVGWMMTLYPFLGIRRRAKIREAVSAWRLRPRRPNGAVWKEGRSRAICHPDLPMRAKGLCNPCYCKAWKALRKAA